MSCFASHSVTLRRVLAGCLLLVFLLMGCAPDVAPPRIITGSPSPSPSPTRTATPRLQPTGRRTLRVTRVPTLTPTPHPARTRPAPARLTPTAPIPTGTDGTPTALREVFITDISGHRQFFSLGCEASAAVDWAAYFGVEINEFNFQYQLPVSDNPEKGFVGNVNDPWGQVPPFSYGVHAGPVAELLRNQYGLPAAARKDFTLEQIKAEIDRGRPFIAWVIGNVTGGRSATYTDREGDTTIVAAYQHVVIVTGYSELTDRIRYMNNGRLYDTPTDVFLDSFAVLGSMALVFAEPLSPISEDISLIGR